MPKKTVEFTEEIYNPVYYPLLGNRKRNLVLVGGAGSGKSVFAAQKILFRILFEPGPSKTDPGHRFLFMRKVGRTIRNSMYKLFKDLVSMYNLDDLFFFQDSKLEIKCPSTRSEIICVGIDNPEKLKSIHGITGIWFEETTEGTEADIRQTDLRLRDRSPFYKQRILTLNPIDEFHHIKIRFVDNYDPQRDKVLVTTYKDNIFLDPAYVRDVLLPLEFEDETYWQIYGKGEWASPKGKIYTFDLCQDWPEHAGKLRAFGLDFGYENPTALVEVIKDGEDLYWKEHIYKTHLTTGDLIERLKILDIGDAQIIADKEEDRIEEIRRAGFNIQAAGKGPGSVNNGIDYNKRHRIHIYAESANLIKEAQNYKRKEVNGRITEDPVKFMDHALDAARYPTYEYIRKFDVSGGVEINFSGFKKAPSRMESLRELESILNS